MVNSWVEREKECGECGKRGERKVCVILAFGNEVRNNILNVYL